MSRCSNMLDAHIRFDIVLMFLFVIFNGEIIVRKVYSPGKDKHHTSKYMYMYDGIKKIIS